MTLSRVIVKTVGWIVGIVVVSIAATGVFVYTYDWNRAKPWIDAKASQALGRPFEIRGNLAVGWQRPAGETGWRAWVPWPTFSASNVVIGNPSWAKSPEFATLGTVRLNVAVLPLLAKTVVIPAIDVVDPVLDVERLEDGRDNWTFAFMQPSQPSKPSPWKVQLRNFGFGKGTVTYRDAITHADLTIKIDTLSRAIPLGDVLAQQESTSRAESATRVGRSGAAQLAARVEAKQASAASAAAAATGTSGASATSAASAVPAVSAASATAGTSRPAGASRAAGSSAASGASGASATSATSGSSSTSSASAPLGNSQSAAQPGAASAGSSASAAAASSASPAYAFGVTVKGRYKGMPVDGTGKLGGVLALRRASQPFPLQADLRAGDTRLALVGTLTDPMHLAALDLRLWLQGASMAHLYPILGVPLPDTPAYATEGRLVGRLRSGASTFRYENFDGRVGGSDLHGTLTYEQRTPRPRLSGSLVSNLLQFSDLAPIIGADTAASKARRGDVSRQPAGRVLPVEQFRTDRWRAVDADVTFTGRKIVKRADLPITDLYTHIVLNDGVLALLPLRFGVAGGTLATDAHLDGSATPLKGRFSVSARHLKLKQLFPTQKTMQSALGEINGDAALSAVGNSPAALAATSNGEIKALVTEGTISKLLMEAAGLNVANVVYEKLFGTKDVRIHCAAADFTATNGVLDTKLFALDTDDAVIRIDGDVNLRDESMNLTIHPQTKGLRVFSLRSPLYVKGTFAKPDVGVNAGALALRAGAVVGLGLVNPFAALIPLIAPSHEKGLACDEMFAQLQRAPRAPPPGKAAVRR